MSSIQSALAAIDSFIWGPPLLILLVGTGIYLTWRLGLLQIVRLPLALKLVFGRDQGQGKQGDVSSFGALCTALSATIGTGNIVGVATAIKLGGRTSAARSRAAHASNSQLSAISPACSTNANACT